MNTKLIATATAAAVVVTSSVVNYVSVVKEERRKRALIAEEEKKQIEAIHAAATKTRAKILLGHYDDDMSIDKVMNDFKFELITSRYED